MRTPKVVRAIGRSLALLMIVASAIAAAGGYHVINRISIPGDSG